MELIVVVAIIGILSGTAYLGIQRGKHKMYNDKVLDDIIGIANALERYNHDHWGEYPVPSPDAGFNMNISCFYADATYAHDCDTSAFRQGMIDNSFLARRYMPGGVPTDPRTGSRYVYGVSTDGKYFMVGGNYEESSGSFVAKTAGNLKKGYHLPSLIRAFNGPNFVTEDGTNLPYSPDHMIITGALRNISDPSKVQVNGTSDGIVDGKVVRTNDIVKVIGDGSVDIYFSDGSVSNLSDLGEMEILEGTEVEENDKDGIITKIRIKLTSGKIWNKVARLASASEFNVETTTAIAGVRGTEFGVDAGANKVLLKSGEICRLNPVEDIPVGDIKNCSGGNVLDELIIGPADNPKIITMNAGAGESSATPTTEPLKTLMDEQSKRYLNDNIRPHIKSIDGLTITVENLRTYYDLPMGVNLEVAELEALDNVGNSVGSLVMTDLSLTDDYELVVTATSYENPITLRFTDDIGPDSGDSIPITITQETSLTGEDLYGIPESVEWVDPYEEIIICDATTMVISGDATFSAGSDDTNKNVTLVWSVTPVECFDGATYSGKYGPEGATTLTDLAISSGSMQSLVENLGNGEAFEWYVTTTISPNTYRFPTDVSINDEFTVPAGDVYCGNNFVDGEEECDNSYTPTPGCIMIGADQCTCNGDLGWETATGGCVCDTTDAAITLPIHIDDDDTTNTPIPINSSLTWEVSPACAFEGKVYGVFIDEDGGLLFINRGYTPSAFFTLTTLFSPTLIPGDIYDWKISTSVGSMPTSVQSIGSFEVECPTTGTIALTGPEANATIVSTNLLSTSFEWDPADPECYFDSSDNYHFEIWLDGGTSSIADCDTVVDATATTPSVNLDTTCITALTAGNYIWKVIRNNSSSVQQIYERSFTVTAAATCTITMVTTPSSVDIDTELQLAWTTAGDCTELDHYRLEVTDDSVGGVEPDISGTATSFDYMISGSYTDELDYTWTLKGERTDYTPVVTAETTGTFTAYAPTPAPVFTVPLAINCTTDCSTNSTYDLNFSVTNATSCIAVDPPSLITIPTPSGGSGSVSAVTLDSGDGSFIFNTDGTESFNTIQITVECDNGVGGTATDSIDVYLAF